MATKSGGKSNFCLNSPVDSSKTFVEIALSHAVSKISVFTFHTEIQDGRRNWWESDFCEKSPLHSGHPGGQKLRQNTSISQPIYVFPFSTKI